MENQLDWYRAQMQNQLWVLGGASFSFYAYYLNHLQLFNEARLSHEEEEIRKIKKNSLDSKTTNLILVLMPRSEN